MDDMKPELNANIIQFLQIYCTEDLERLQTGAYEHPVVHISLTDLYTFNENLYLDTVENPERIRPLFKRTVNDYEDAAEDAVSFAGDDRPISTPKFPLPDEEIKVEYTDPPTSLRASIGEPRNDYFGQLIAFEGICRQTSDPKPRILQTVFECERCGSEMGPISVEHTFDFDKATPHECSGCERQGPFVRVKEREKRDEYQQLKLQEPPESAENASNPREIVCDAIGEHLIDRVTPGDRVTVVGVLSEDEDSDSTLLDARLDVESVIPEEVQFEDVELEDEDIERVEELAESDQLYDYLQNTIAPSIFGHRKKKLAIALQMFGGVTRHEYGNRKRGEIHQLLIGEPGTGKSQLLESARSYAPRSVSSDGTGSTEVGLTATAVKETIGDEEQWTLQAGSLVLADGGLITIDELDNMRHEQQQSLDGALSEGRIHVDKANVHSTLKARCSALMAANPKDGRFNKQDPYPEQFDIPKELLNRCDLVWTFEDTVDQEKDAAIADTILDVGQGEQAAADGGQPMAVDENGVVGPELMRKYIAYARREHNPTLTEEPREKLKDFYTNIRAMNSEDQPAINTRKLEGAKRIAEASARARLSDVVELEDAERAIELVMGSLKDAGRDPEGEGFSVDMMEGRTGSPSQQKRVSAVYDVVTELEKENESGAGLEKIVETLDFERKKIESAIQTLKDNGELYSPQKDYFRTT